jgi:cation diffusion facilitator family transporter
MKETTNIKRIKEITVIGLIINIFISLIKFIVGIIGHSQAVVADGVHSFSDTSTDLVILFGVKFWTAPPDEKHPYGHKKIESFATIIIGIILFAAALGIGYNAIITIKDTHIQALKLITLIGPVLSIIFKEYLFRKTYKIGRETGSSSVKANAWHHRSDALSSIPVLIAVVASLIDRRLQILDHIGAIVVAVFILKMALVIIYKNIMELTDIAISSDEENLIGKIISSHPQVKSFHRVRTRKIGDSYYLDLHLKVDGSISVKEGHDISEEVKKNLFIKNPKIIDILIHLEPEKNPL